MVDAPPGRAGRLWLRERLDAAQRGAELLERQRRLLLAEEERLARAAEETGSDWAEATARARRWDVRVAVLGGTPAALRTAAPVSGRAEVEVAWHDTAGVHRPREARCRLPTLDAAELAAADGATAPAAEAFRRAVEAAAAHATAQRAYDEVAAALASVRRRVRALEHHRIPALQEAMDRLVLQLEEREREERVVTRWAQRTRSGRARG